ncbi:MAG: PEGA domain-containing protein [Thermodesulfobacteriota bacterium]
MVRGSKETYQVISEPPGAIAIFSSGELCTTPCAVNKKRDEPFFVRIVKEGYQPYDIRVEEKAFEGRGPTMLANLLMFGSVIWASIDRFSGANKELTPNPSLASLEPVRAPAESYERLSARTPGFPGGNSVR